MCSNRRALVVISFPFARRPHRQAVYRRAQPEVYDRRMPLAPTRPLVCGAGAHQTQCAEVAANAGARSAIMRVAQRTSMSSMVRINLVLLLAVLVSALYLVSVHTTPGVCSPRWIVPIPRLCVWRSSTSVWRLRNVRRPHRLRVERLAREHLQMRLAHTWHYHLRHVHTHGA